MAVAMIARRLLATGAALVALASCSTSEQRPTDPGDAANQPSGVAIPHGEPGHEHDTTPIEGAGTVATSAARRVVALWARPDLTAEAWWRNLEPLLSASAQQAYAWTDPTTVPRLEVLSAQVADDATATTPTYTVVDVDTTRGVIAVTLTRTTVESGWVMDRMDLTEVLQPTAAPGSTDGDLLAAAEAP